MESLIDVDALRRLGQVEEMDLESPYSAEVMAWIEEGGTWPTEVARGFAAKGGKAAKQARVENQKTAEARAKDLLRVNSPKLAQKLLEAALGDGIFEDLDPIKRLDALKVALAYGIGKPVASAPEPEPEPEKSDGEKAITFGVRQETAGA